MFSFVIVLVLRSKKDKYKDCCELYWIWLTVWFGLNLNLSRLKVPCHLFPAPHTNEIFTQFRNCARSEDKYQSCLSAPSAASQSRQPTPNLPSLVSLTSFSCAFYVVKMHFDWPEDPAGTGCPCKGAEVPALQGVWEGGAASLLAQQTQSDESKGRQGWQQRGLGPPGFQHPLGNREHKCTFPEPLMCTQAASSQAGNMTVLGCFTKRAGIYELSISAHDLKQEGSNSILQTACIINLCDFSSLNCHLRVLPLQT